MHYLVQENVFQEPRYDQIFEVLDTLGLSFQITTFNRETKRFDFELNRKDVFVYGSVPLAKQTAKMDLDPGSFYGGNHTFKKYADGFGKNVLNHGSAFQKLGKQINWRDNKQAYFIKPSMDAKAFTGKVFNRFEWEEFVYQSLHDPNNFRVNANTEVQIITPKKLIKEARIWIVDRQIVTSSYYRFHDGAEFEPTVAQAALDFASQMANKFEVAKAFVMDVGLTFNGWEIVEVNCINSAGFYQGDVLAIVKALEKCFN